MPLGLAVAALGELADGARHRSTGDDHRVAASRPPLVLGVEKQAPLRHTAVGSGTGATIRRQLLGRLRGLPLRARVEAAVIPSPVHASHAGCGLTALRAAAPFATRVISALGGTAAAPRVRFGRQAERHVSKTAEPLAQVQPCQQAHIVSGHKYIATPATWSIIALSSGHADRFERTCQVTVPKRV